MKKTKNKLLPFLLLISINGFSKEPTRLISGYGDFKKVSDIEFNIPKKYKAVFDVYTSDDDKEKVNRGINTVARFLNMHYDAGVKPKNMKVALVIHGAAGKDILSNSAYRKHFATDNPNTLLLKQLYDNNVQIILCGQTAGYRGYERKDILDYVDVSLSAITALLSLQSKGYGLIDFN